MPSLFHLPSTPPTITPSTTSQLSCFPSYQHSYHHRRAQDPTRASASTPRTTMPHPVVYTPDVDRHQHRRSSDPSQSHSAQPFSKLHNMSYPSSSSLKTPSPQQRRIPSTVVPRSLSPLVGCHCKKSRCLKLYCPCFAASQFCQDASCRCEDCQNLTSHAEHVEQIRTVVLHKHTALKKALLSSNNNKSVFHKATSSHASTSTTTTTTIPPLSCKCVRSECLKKYCDCYHQGMYCTESCRCHNCQNVSPNVRTSSNPLLLPPSTRQWNHPSPYYYWNQTLPPPHRSIPLHWNSSPPPPQSQPPQQQQQVWGHGVYPQLENPNVQPRSTENSTLRNNDKTISVARHSENDEKRITSSRSNDNNLQSFPDEDPVDNDSNKISKDRNRIEDEHDNDTDEDVDATMLAALAMTQLSGKRKQNNETDILWTPASKISKSSSCSGGSESRNPSPVFRASPVAPSDTPSSATTVSLSSFHQPAVSNYATTFQYSQQIQSPMQKPPIYTLHRNRPHPDLRVHYSHSFPMRAGIVYNPRSPQQQCYPSVKEIPTMSSNVTALPRSLSFRKICSKCGKTRAEHGELGFGNKCPYEDCGKCGASIKCHTAIGISMGITCTLTTAQGAVPGSADLYYRKIQNLAERAELQRNLQQQSRRQHVVTAAEREL